MDNPNDFIHIDDVFKRLKDNEEPEPSGAWLRMQDLLNEEMPIGAPAAGSMVRRYMIPLVALLLIGGGVALYSSKNRDDAALNKGQSSFASNNLSNKNSNLLNENGKPRNNLSATPNAANTPDHLSENNLSNGHSSNNPGVADINSSHHNNVSESGGRAGNGKHHNLQPQGNTAIVAGVSNYHHASENGGHTGNDHHHALQATSSATVVATSAGKNVHAPQAGNNNADPALSKDDKATINNQVAVHKDAKAAKRNHHSAVTPVLPSVSGSGNNNVAAGNQSTADNTSTGSNKNNSTTTSSNNVASNTTSTKLKGNTAKGSVALEQQNVVEEIYPGSSSNAVASANNTSSNSSSSANGKGKKGKKKNVSNAGATTVAGMNVVAANWKNNKIVEDENGSYYKEVRDTFKKIDMVSRAVASNNNGTKGITTKIDTLAITRVERIKFLPLEPMEMVALREAKIIPQATVITPINMTKAREYTVTNEMVNMVPLANYKVNSRKVDPGKFNQIMQSTTQGISNYFDGTNKFYAAIMGGGNAFVSSPGAFGMQLGIAALYQLSERLTMGFEFKFANHYFSNYSINDQSVNYDNVSSSQVSGIEWLFKGTQTTSTSAYKIKSFSELQFPVTLSYSLGRLSVFGGVNLAYAMPVKWDKSNSYSTQTVSSSESQNANPFLNQNFSLDEKKDFSSRFGMGYVAGLSYDINRKISLDARLTQNLWSSYSGDADAIGKLFKTPTFQFSIGYFFGRKERVVYIMDKR